MDFKNKYSKHTGYIFESPDKGETIYKRKIGETERTLSNKEEFKTTLQNIQKIVKDLKKMSGFVLFVVNQHMMLSMIIS